uniref:Uncharacterized protein n=1 Tax=Ursus maritimus TaxID=29073 RepID=A0A452VAF9_URSMA
SNGQPPPSPVPVQSSGQLWPAPSAAPLLLVGMKGSLVALNAALKLVLYLLNKYCCSCLSCSLGLWD